MTHKSPVPRDLLEAIKEIIRYSILSMASLRDPDSRYLGLAQMPQHVVRDIRDAYGYSSTWVRKFRATPRDLEQMEIALPWVAWIRREEGDTACRRIIAWAMGSPMWRIGQREGCSDRTVQNRIDRSVSAIILKFVGVEIPVEVVEEPYRGVNYAIVFERPHGQSGEVKIQKVYIGGVGYMKGGKIIRDSKDKFDLERMAV